MAKKRCLICEKEHSPSHALCEGCPPRPPHRHSPGDTISACDAPGCRQAVTLSKELHERAEKASAPPMLVPFLELAVSVCVDRWVAEGKTLDEVLELGRQAGEVLECAASEPFIQAHEGIPRKAGHLTQSFAVLTRALAAGSFVPGGSRYGGACWESDPSRLRKSGRLVAKAPEASP